jgi:integrase
MFVTFRVQSFKRAFERKPLGQRKRDAVLVLVGRRLAVIPLHPRRRRRHGISVTTRKRSSRLQRDRPHEAARVAADEPRRSDFRSTFSDWAAETTNFSGEVAEAALAHANGDKVAAAYRRGDLFEKRRRLMEAWGSYCTAPAAAGAGEAR